MKFVFSPPNQLTFLRILLTPVFLFFLFSPDLLLRQLSVAVFILAMLTDWYDGWVARRWGYITRWGAFFDPFADKVVISAGLFAFVIIGLVPAWTVWTIFVRDMAITFLRSYAEFKGRTFDTSSFAKTKTFLQFVTIYYILILYVARETPALRHEWRWWIDTLLDPTVLYTLMVIITIITLWTGVLYILENWKTILDIYGARNRVTESQR